jgi:hypothetical protein
VETPKPAKKKRVYVLVVTSFCVCANQSCCCSVVAQRTPTPSPGSQDYQDLPAVSVSCVLLIRFCSLLFLTYSLRLCSDLVLAAMKNSVTTSASGNSPVFGSQDLAVDDTRYNSVAWSWVTSDEIDD